MLFPFQVQVINEIHDLHGNLIAVGVVEHFTKVLEITPVRIRVNGNISAQRIFPCNGQPAARQKIPGIEHINIKGVEI